ncbi:MAG: hypothetical protein C0598_03405 [Marinilabiliales bacterium]|nr:MAG: hypothetical protein C0598_03405 [Marinilabiliales bacterium]
MTLLETNILTCPNCSKFVQVLEVLSFHIFESEVYSDGKADTTPIMPNTSRILICPECNKEFWLEDAKNILDNEIISDEIKDVATPTELFSVKNSDNLLGLSLYYKRLLDDQFAKTTDRESYLRILLWHELNNIVRYNIPIRNEVLVQCDKMIFENLVQLVKIFNPVYLEEKLMLAEMYRELGEFDFAIEILKTIEDDYLNDRKEELLTACKKKTTKVFKLKNN